VELSTIAIIICIGAIILFATEWIPLAVTAVLACLVMGITGVLTWPQAFAGFSNNIVIFIAGLSVMSTALFETGGAVYLGKKVVNLFGGNEKSLLMGLMFISCILSAFLSNLAVTMVMISIVAAAAATSGGKITKKNTYMGIAFAGIFGGNLTLIGSTPQLAIKGLLDQANIPGLGFFTLAIAGIPMCIVFLLYYYFFGYEYSKKVFDFEEIQDVPASPGSQSDTPSKKMWIPIITFAVCIVGFVTETWTLGAVAMCGAAVVLLTGCVTQKQMFQRMDWVTIVILAGTLGFASGLDKSGAAKIIADFVIQLLGSDPSPFMVFAVATLLVTVLTQVMSNTAVSIMLMPIILAMCGPLGMNPLAMAMGVISGAAISIVTPIATTSTTAILSAGYRFMDFVKVGGILAVITYIVVIIVIPIFIPLTVAVQ
jgi:sodium-dependent dicarboxylate transporter 2/3/5